MIETSLRLCGPPGCLGRQGGDYDHPNRVCCPASIPIAGGLVESLNRPGGNATGMTLLTGPLGQKRIEQLRELVPKAAVVTMLANPLSPDAVPEIRDVQIAAQANGVELKMYNASTRTELDAAFGAIAAQRPDALLVGSDPFYVVRRDDFVAFAARYKIPAIYPFREFADAGGLITTTKRILQTLAVKPAFTLVRFSKERNLRGFPSCGQLRSKWS